MLQNFKDILVIDMMMGLHILRTSELINKLEKGFIISDQALKINNPIYLYKLSFATF